MFKLYKDHILISNIALKTDVIILFNKPINMNLQPNVIHSQIAKLVVMILSEQQRCLLNLYFCLGSFFFVKVTHFIWAELLT